MKSFSLKKIFFFSKKSIQKKLYSFLKSHFIIFEKIFFDIKNIIIICNTCLFKFNHQIFIMKDINDIDNQNLSFHYESSEISSNTID